MEGSTPSPRTILHKGKSMKKKLTFEEWEKEVDKIVIRRTGCSLYDLPDCPTRYWYENDESPSSAASLAIQSAKE